ncbi:ribosome small subunit-dependent GTPase A [Candidatus Nomurabacteria bacterium]|nr:ribosome small subunit-dependent GTPase A [Candidatus Kaiserbacteria bacterium]MCB9813787.1 ribosome small subunit-dependent GTPase A [Candidatus Nomurabacteria bacterium]
MTVSTATNNNLLKGRVTEAHRTNFTVTMAEGNEVTATVRGVFHADKDFPKVGDYVLLTLLEDEKAVIEEILPRQSVIKRRAADSDEEQIIATNVDLIFVVMGLDSDFNISRLERYLLLAKQSDIKVVVLLNKSDVVDDTESCLQEVKQVTGEVSVHLVSAKEGAGMPTVADYFTPDTTAVLLGSSGAGKSTITNWLLQSERQAVNELRETDGRGRHTTTSRQLFAIPHGGYLIDTPGMRELGVLDSDTEDELAVFERIESFMSECQFSNCDHTKSQGCAVLAALKDGLLTERELQNYHKILQERAFQESKESTTAARHFKQNQKRLHQKYSAIQRQKYSR